jgi:hypothetical protein
MKKYTDDLFYSPYPFQRQVESQESSSSLIEKNKPDQKLEHSDNINSSDSNPIQEDYLNRVNIEQIEQKISQITVDQIWADTKLFEKNLASLINKDLDQTPIEQTKTKVFLICDDHHDLELPNEFVNIFQDHGIMLEQIDLISSVEYFLQYLEATSNNLILVFYCGAKVSSHMLQTTDHFSTFQGKIFKQSYIDSNKYKKIILACPIFHTNFWALKGELFKQSLQVLNRISPVYSLILKQ